jgi:branched-chain amino acid transport system ATP-binding protein
MTALRQEHAVNEILRCDGVKVYYGGVHAVDDVSLQLEDGALHGLIGPNGSGKSTLLGAMSRMTGLTAGFLWLKGQRYDELPAHEVARRGVRRTFQTVRLLPDLTVLENVMVGADAPFLSHGIWQAWVTWRRSYRAERESRGRAMDAIQLLSLDGLERVRCGTLPYGTQRKVELARCVAAGPDVLLLDEPTAGMSRAERGEIAKLLLSLRGAGMTQLLVEHDVDLITSVCDHLWVMNLGTVIAEGKPREVISRPEVEEAYLGKAQR